MSTVGKRGTAAGSPTTPLDRSKIVHVALDLLDEVGLDGLSTRLLAARLGVKSPALYWHFKNKRDLVDAMAEAMMDAAVWPAPPPLTADVKDWMAKRAHTFRKALLSRRDGARVHAGTQPNSRQLAAIQTQMLALVTSGMAPTQAARAALALSRYTVGWVLEEQASQARAEPNQRRIDLRPFPILQAASDVFDGSEPTKNFDYGVRAILAGPAPGLSPG